MKLDSRIFKGNIPYDTIEFFINEQFDLFPVYIELLQLMQEAKEGGKTTATIPDIIVTKKLRVLEELKKQDFIYYEDKTLFLVNCLIAG